MFDTAANDETRRNTWYNETLVTSTTSLSCTTLTDHCAASTTMSGTSSTVTLTDQCTASSPSPTPQISVSSTTSATSVMSCASEKSGLRDRSVCSPDTCPAHNTSLSPAVYTPTNRSDETIELRALVDRVHALEKVYCSKLVL